MLLSAALAPRCCVGCTVALLFVTRTGTGPTSQTGNCTGSRPHIRSPHPAAVNPSPRRLLLHWMGGVVCQLRYSFVWLLSEASLTFMGLNLKGWDEKGAPVWWVWSGCKGGLWGGGGGVQGRWSVSMGGWGDWGDGKVEAARLCERSACLARPPVPHSCAFCSSRSIELLPAPAQAPVPPAPPRLTPHTSIPTAGACAPTATLWACSCLSQRAPCP